MRRVPCQKDAVLAPDIGHSGIKIIGLAALQFDRGGVDVIGHMLQRVIVRECIGQRLINLKIEAQMAPMPFDKYGCAIGTAHEFGEIF